MYSSQGRRWYKSFGCRIGISPQEPPRNSGGCSPGRLWQRRLGALLLRLSAAAGPSLSLVATVNPVPPAPSRTSPVRRLASVAVPVAARCNGMGMMMAGSGSVVDAGGRGNATMPPSR
ncbi:hypothetical protein BRADI_1g24753v3 [Brachypodium distachyon]|uniref:Uncharacterized protein n=1 Tax=Brachypodium distachyon TaxID=15368 RepID=A0A2K2DKX6_BRADI|nr:hypothetical protein BRADI_1g24753v3 [Brachypodium distachyon]